MSRQPVLDDAMKVVGYRVAYALKDGYELPGGHPAVLFDTALSVIGLQELVGDTIAHLPIAGEWLLALGAAPGRPERVMLRIAQRDAVDPAVRVILEQAIERGFRLELCGLQSPEFDERLLDLFTAVELDIGGWATDAAGDFASQLRRRGLTPLGANIRDHAERVRAERLGCQWFTGPFSGLPTLVSGRKIPTGELGRIASIIRMDADRTPFEEVVDVIEQDLGLSVKLLRYLNSAYFGMATTVSSVHHAALRLGSRNVTRWALTIAIAGAPHITREVAVTALTRARLCELLAGAANADSVDGGEMFTIGLLSAADVVFGCELNDIICELPLTQRVTKALLVRDGPAGKVLRAALAYERGDFEDPALARLVTGHGQSFRSALRWAQDMLPPPE